MPTRSRISPAALFVNVIARISFGARRLGREQVGDPVGEHPGLARAGAGEDQSGPRRYVTASRCGLVQALRAGRPRSVVDLRHRCASTVAAGGGREAGEASPTMSLTSPSSAMAEAIYRASDGRIGHEMLGVPTLLLDDHRPPLGAAANELHWSTRATAATTCWSPRRAAADKRAGRGCYNLTADPQVPIAGRARARIDGAARVIERIRPGLRAASGSSPTTTIRDRYTAYQQQTSRPIPVIALAPAEARPSVNRMSEPFARGLRRGGLAEPLRGGRSRSDRRVRGEAAARLPGGSSPIRRPT